MKNNIIQKGNMTDKESGFSLSVWLNTNYPPNHSIFYRRLFLFVHYVNAYEAPRKSSDH
jgi:hypothetical protein